MSRWSAGIRQSVHFDRGVGFAVAARVSQLLAAPITLLVIARFFSPELQGFHYTFMSLIALQSFAELGFGVVIINTASHQWARLGLGQGREIVGDRDALSRLVSLGRLTARWYAMASAVFVVLVGAVGLWFFGETSNGVRWKEPWIVLVLIAGAQLWMLSLTAILEGCNQIAEVYQFRIAQAVVCNATFWAVASGGGGLWAGVAMAAARLGVDGILVGIRYRPFFRVFWQSPDGPSLTWRTDVWPMQWRLALSGFTHYFATSLFAPVMFWYHGPVVAGRMGMSWQAIGGIQSVAGAWLTSRAAVFGGLVARRQRLALDHLWSRTSAASLLIFVLGALAFAGLLAALAHAGSPLADRLLDPWPLALLLVASLIVQIAHCQTVYMRAHRVEPIVLMSVTTNVTMGIVVWLLGATYGPVGAAFGTVSVAIVLLTWETSIWRRFKAAASHRGADAA